MRKGATMKKILIGIGIGLIVLAAAAALIFYPSYKFFTSTELVSIGQNVNVMLGGGGNSGIIAGDSAVLVVDTKMMGTAEALAKFTKERAGSKPIIVVNTHYHSDHTGGNKYYQGSRIYIGGYTKEFILTNVKAENRPTDFVGDSLIITLGGETIHLYNLGQAHTLNDLVVYLEKHNMLFTGDLVFDRINPVLKKESEANIQKWIGVLDVILKRWPGAVIVPGHGKIGTIAEVEAQRTYFVDILAAAADPSKEEKVKEKYKDWMGILNMSSPEKSIEYARSNP
jgi:glyoxylase-like metal-dependent hydrolase (beta-lactamase superfamily II)